jgi:hypothetical protein
MADYDETNRGAAFAPFPTQKMILQGKINDSGRDMKVILVADKTKSDKKIVEVYAKVGVLFENEKKEAEGAPDYTGPINETRRLAAWKRMKDDKPYMSFNVTDEKRQGSAPAKSTPKAAVIEDDDIPW